MNTHTSRARLAVWVGSTHPVPSLAVATFTTVFAWSAGLAPWQVVVVFLAMLANQTGIGLGNDWLDAASDRTVGRTDKPLARGDISLNSARNIAIALGVIALALSLTLGVWALVCQAVMLAAGWWYNLHAKGHWSSVLSYMLGFSLLPVFPLLALTPPALPPWWVVVVAGTLGASAHFANALPDVITDRELGVRGLPQRLGPRWSGVLIALGVIASTTLITAQGSVLPLWMRMVTITLAVGGALLATALSFRPVPPRVIFPLVIASAGVSVAAIAVAFWLG